MEYNRLTANATDDVEGYGPKDGPSVHLALPVGTPVSPLPGTRHLGLWPDPEEKDLEDIFRLRRIRR